MSKVVRALCLVLVLTLTGATFADDVPDVASVLKTRMVSIEVSIVELAEKPSPVETLDPESSQQLISRIRELETQGKLAGLTRLRLSTLDNNQVSAQTSQRLPMETGRNVFPGQPGRGGMGSSPTFQFQNFGTVVRAITRIEPGDTIVMDLQIEKTSALREARPATAETARPDVIAPTGMVTTEFKSTVRVPNGQTIVVQASGSSSATENPSRTVILVTAYADQAPQVAAAKLPPPQAQPPLTVFVLKSAKVGDMYEVLQQLFNNVAITMAVDVRTNTLFVKASPENIKLVENVITILDKVPAPESGEKKTLPGG